MDKNKISFIAKKVSFFDEVVKITFKCVIRFEYHVKRVMLVLPSIT